MKTSDIPIDPLHIRKQLFLHDLLKRAQGPRRTSWLDLPKEPGIYVIR
jgi:hypothetical protein